MAAVIAQSDELAAEAVRLANDRLAPVSTYPALDALARSGFPPHAERQEYCAAKWRLHSPDARNDRAGQDDSAPPATSFLSWSPSRGRERAANIDDNAVLDDLFDSLGRIEFLSRVEERFGVALTDTDWAQYRTSATSGDSCCETRGSRRVRSL